MMKEKLVELCRKSLQIKALGEEYSKRLELELQDIDDQNEYDYFIDLYQQGTKYPSNVNNLLVPWLLGIVEDFDISKEPEYTYGDFPDIDVDYLPVVQKYIREQWAKEQFGENRVCLIGNYATFGIKNSLLDMAKVFSKPKSEIYEFSTKMGIKDDDGNVLTWDEALKMSDEFRQYCVNNPEVTDAAKRLLHRNKQKGKHAGGLIISSVDLDEFVPIIIDGEGNRVSAWVEGLHATDLQPVGLIKFDVLSIINLLQIAYASKLVKERHGLEKICALPGQKDWSDETYLNDPKALEMANNGELRCVFQFDSEGIRNLVKAGGVDNFEDLVAYTALYRPGPMKMKMHDAYTRRKKGLEEYVIHPVLKPILGKTYSVMVFQEQIMCILHVVGKIPLKDCEIVRKAISKKKEKIFKSYQKMFIENGQKVLGCSLEEIQNLWEQIDAFSGYGFNRAHSVGYTITSSRLLYLKAHYPLEFFTAILMCESKEEKIREYRLEARRMGIDINPVDLNISESLFSIKNDKIYMGISNIKGIGYEVAADIASKQPFENFEDFLERVEPSATIMKPIIGLNLFQEAPRVVLWEYYAYWSDHKKKIKTRLKSFAKSRENMVEKLKEFIPDATEETFTILEETDDKKLSALIRRWHKTLADQKEKLENIENLISLSDFTPTGEILAELHEMYTLEQHYADVKYYGFSWNSPLETSLNYTPGMGFGQFDTEEDISVMPVQVRVIEKPERREFKSGKGHCYQLTVEDENFRRERVTVWSSDFERFKEEFGEWNEDYKHGNNLQIRVRRPEGGFNNFTFDTYPRFHKIPPKNQDYRLILMQ